MAPALATPAGVVFVDDHERIIHSDASAYYGGKETYSRSRTYSNVSHPHHLARRRLLARAQICFHRSRTSTATIRNGGQCSRTILIFAPDECRTVSV